MTVQETTSGQFSGEGWLPDQSQPVYLTRSGWAYFQARSSWFYLPYVCAGGPTFDEWRDAGAPVHGLPPAWVPPESDPYDAPRAVSGSPATPPAPPTAGGQPSVYDGVGWMQDATGWVYRQGDGHLWSATREEWSFRPDLMTGLPPSPGPVPLAVKAHAEVKHLRTPWPSYGAAWRHAKREHWLSRYYAMFGWISSWYGCPRPCESPRWWPREVPTGGQEKSPPRVRRVCPGVRP